MSSAQFNIHEAKTHLSRIIERVERGGFSSPKRYWRI